MTPESFDRWFASYLGETEIEVARLLNDKTAVRFLIAWSTFESKCCEGFMKAEKINGYANCASTLSAMDAEGVPSIAEYFHARYQDKDLYRRLNQKQRSDALKRVVDTPFGDLAKADIAFMLLFVVYRFRNNIFHGNKGVYSWLQYREQIGHCITVMQALITASVAHNHALQPTSTPSLALRRGRG